MAKLTTVKPQVSVQAVAGTSSGIHPAAASTYTRVAPIARGSIGITGSSGSPGIPGIDGATPSRIQVAKDAIMNKLGITQECNAEVLHIYEGWDKKTTTISLTLSSEYYDLNTIDNRSHAFKMLQNFHSLAYECWGIEKVVTSLRNFRGPDDQSLDCSFEIPRDRLHFCLERGEKVGYETGIL